MINILILFEVIFGIGIVIAYQYENKFVDFENRIIKKIIAALHK